MLDVAKSKKGHLMSNIISPLAGLIVRKALILLDVLVLIDWLQHTVYSARVRKPVHMSETYPESGPVLGNVDAR